MYLNTYSHNQLKKCSSIHVLLLAVFAAVYLTPILSDVVSPVLMVGIIALSLILYLYRGTTRKNAVLFLLCILWMFYSVFLRLAGWSSAAWGNYLHQFGFYFTIIAMCFIREHMSEKQKKTLACLITVIIVANLIDNIRLNALYPSASVNVIRLDWYPELKGLNIGSTRFSTMLLFFFAATLFVFLSTHSKKQKLLFAVLSVLTAYYLIYQGMRASVIFLLLLLFAMMLYISYCVKHNVKVGGIIVVVIAVIAVTAFMVPILEFLRDLINVPRITERIDDIIYSLENGIEGDSFSGRFDLYLISLKTFLNNLFFGAGDHRVALSQVQESGIGGHSEFIDMLARYGMIGASVVTSILVMAFQKVKSFMHNRLYTVLTSVVLVTFVLCGFLKSVIYPEVGVVLFLLFPNIQYMIKTDYSKPNP